MVMNVWNVLGIDLLQTRIFGNKIYVEIEIQADASYTLQEAHNIAETVHDDIEQNSVCQSIYREFQTFFAFSCIITTFWLMSSN